ncbi:hypothetical protein Ahy_B06g084210 [Arachis hypogaea]|uniref:PB1-like domain-containing protein n=1 Tax=Arachis hypogaea TaxID=3818 RepID=A0A444YRC7_ARAHY|nr:hypothetical protein Ahy_B06g084210 [Arachis hypogaea]
MNAEVLDIMFHHGRNFEKGKNRRWTYYPDNKYCLGEVDVDRLDVFYLRNYFKELGDGVIDVYIKHGISKPEILQGQDVIVHLDNQVKDLGEQAKPNATIVLNLFPKTTTEKEVNDYGERLTGSVLSLEITTYYKKRELNSTFSLHKEYMDRIKGMNENVWAYLDKWPREIWTRSQFRHNSKLDSICNNACEIFK